LQFGINMKKTLLMRETSPSAKRPRSADKRADQRKLNGWERSLRFQTRRSAHFTETDMSIFSTILNKIFPHDHPAASGSGAAAAPATPQQPSPAGATAAPSGSSTPAAAGAVQPPVTPMPVVDVEAVLSSMQANQGQELNWRTSIVDLMKLLGLDSSLAARKELATELHYSGNTEDSAAMNMWLHKAVMQKLAQNGGKVPDDLKD
jgi:hypothetical protein